MNIECEVETTSYEKKMNLGKRFYDGYLILCYDNKGDAISSFTGQMSHHEVPGDILVDISNFAYLGKKFRPNLTVIKEFKWPLSFKLNYCEKGFFATDIIISDRIHKDDESTIVASLNDYIQRFYVKGKRYYGGLIDYLHMGDDGRSRPVIGQIVHKEIPLQIFMDRVNFGQNGARKYPNLSNLFSQKWLLSFELTTINDKLTAIEIARERRLGIDEPYLYCSEGTFKQIINNQAAYRRWKRKNNQK